MGPPRHITDGASAAAGKQQPAYTEAMETMNDGTTTTPEPAVGLHARVMPPEQRVRHLAELVMRQTEVTRQYNGRGRGRTYADSKDAIRDSARQLAEYVIAYLNGEDPKPW